MKKNNTLLNNQDSQILFCPLGGSGEIGANMNLYGFKKNHLEEWIIVDMGVSFTDDSIPGIDLIVPDPDFIVQKKKKLKALIITHGHEDHIGAITFLWPLLKCPIYATAFTASLINEKFKEKKINIDEFLNIVPNDGVVNLDSIKINFISLTHSILEPNALLIEFNDKKIFHTGDWKCDLNPVIGKKIDEEKLKKIGKQNILAMICDSTNIFSEGRSGSEKDVKNSLLNIFESQKNRIIISIFASNAARMQTIIQCAEKVNRQVSLVGRSMNRIYNIAKKCGYLQNLKPVIDPRDSKKIPKNKIVYLCTGSQGEPMGAMSRIANETHPDVYAEADDTVIFSSRIIPGNEKKLFKLHNLLVRKKVNVISEDNSFVHVSGHPGREELKDMYSWINPKISIPVHGEHRHLKEHYEFAKNLKVQFPMLIENGDIIELSDNEPNIIDKATNGKLLVDGNQLINEESQFLKDRKNISFNGFLSVNLIVSRSGHLDKNPIIDIKGLPLNDDDTEEIKFELEDQIRHVCKSFSLNNKKQEKNFIDALKGNLKKIMFNKIQKKPYTNINLIKI
jgi:ribonuclease J